MKQPSLGFENNSEICFCTDMYRGKQSCVVIHTSFFKVCFFFTSAQLLSDPHRTKLTNPYSLSAIAVVRRAVCSVVAIRLQDCYLGNWLQLQKGGKKNQK